MQKIIIIALLATCAIAATANVKKADGTAMAGTADGFVVSMGVIQRCHLTCLTCDGPLETNCLTCHPADAGMPTTGNKAGVAMALGTASPNTGKCGCFATGKTGITALGGKFHCNDNALTGNDINATVALCKAAGPAWFDTPNCVMCAAKFKTCTAADATESATASMCWAGVTSTLTACTYTKATSYISGDDNAYDQGTETLSVINGYFYTATGFTQTPCNKGCMTCDLAATTPVKCSTCAANFVVNADKTACSCNAEGFFTTAATTAAVDLCTACGTGCKTCSSATVCTVCDSSHSLGSTTSSSSTCESAADTSATTSTDDTTTTSGTADGETSATATATNGVLITAASMLLAVILA